MSTVGSEYRDDRIRAKLAESTIAGGEEYVNDLDESEIPKKEDADFVVPADADADEFYNATNTANNDGGGGVVYVEDGAKIDFSGASGAISDCTVVSGRGQGSDGALLYTNDHGQGTHAWDAGPGTGLFTLEGNVRFFGIRFRGPTHDYWDSEYHPGYIPFKFGELDAGERDDFRGEWMSRGVNIQGDDVTVENCKLWGFSTHGFSVGGHDSEQYYEPDIIACDVHDNMQSGLGYNVNVYRGNPNISLTYFNASRHTLATFGYADSGYTVEDSVVGPSTSLFLLDTHSLGENSASESTNPAEKDFVGRSSGNIEVRRVTFTPERVIEDADYDAGQPTNHMSMGGVPWPWPPDEDNPGAVIENCRCAHDSLDEAFYQGTSGDGWEVPTDDDGFSENVIVRNMQFGAPDAPKKEGIGAPIDLTEPPEDVEPPEPEGPKTGEFSVYAEDAETGERLNGVVITISAVGRDFTETGETSDIEIADGGVMFGELPVGYYHITAKEEGYQTGTYDSELWRDEGEAENEAMHLDDDQRRPIIYMTPKADSPPEPEPEPEEPEPEEPEAPEVPESPDVPDVPESGELPELESRVRTVIREEFGKLLQNNSFDLNVTSENENENET